jgi:hypothetical protein
MYIGTLSKTGTGRSAVAAPDHFQTPFNVGVAATLSGAATFSIEYSMDDPMVAGFDPAIADWFVAPGFSGVSASTGGSLTIPCRAICINVASGTGSVTVELVQSGPA